MARWSHQLASVGGSSGRALATDSRLVNGGGHGWCFLTRPGGVMLATCIRRGGRDLSSLTYRSGVWSRQVLTIPMHMSITDR